MCGHIQSVEFTYSRAWWYGVYYASASNWGEVAADMSSYFSLMVKENETTS